LDQAGLLQVVEEILGNELIREQGQVLFNSIDTLAPNEVYVVGHNPGGHGHRTISQDLMRAEYRQHGWSAFDEPWANKRYGRGVKELLRLIGYSYRTVPITNTFFSASPTESAFPEMTGDRRQRYMRMHYKLLSIVGPKYVICLGQSAFGYFREWAVKEDPLFDEDLDDGRFYRVSYPDIRPVHLIGIRHPARGPRPTKEFHNRFAKIRQVREERLPSGSH
jgi:uracil-DNA glycosylase